MARPTLRGHRKFKRLMRILNLPEPYVLGLLQMIWDAAYESGDDVLGDSLDVESVAGWPGERGVLTQALLDAGGEQAGFIEAAIGRPGAFQVHDLWEHAPRYVQRRAEREAQRKASGRSISEIRREAGSIGGRQTANKRAPVATEKPTTGQQEGSNQQQMVVTPAPAPAPNKNMFLLEPTEALPPPSDGFDAFWAAWPRKDAKKPAHLVWKRLTPEKRRLAVEGIPAYLAHAKPDFLMLPTTWLNQERWNDKGGNGKATPPQRDPSEGLRIQAEVRAEADRQMAEAAARQGGKP